MANNLPPGFPTEAYSKHLWREVNAALEQSKAAIERLLEERRLLQLEVTLYQTRYRAIRETLQSVEWVPDCPAPSWKPRCPGCGRVGDMGHATDCRVAQALAEV